MPPNLEKIEVIKGPGSVLYGSRSGDTIPVLRGRTVYFGLEVSLKRE
jgi:outer membrane receptor for ferrienterochelin and colicin